MSGLPIRTRITAAFTVALAIVLAAVGGFVYVRTGADLLDGVDAGLRSRADVVIAEVRSSGGWLPPTPSRLIESDEAFVQIASADGSIERSDAIVARTPLLPASTIRRIDHAVFADRRVPGIDDVVRVLAVPVPADAGRVVVLVGTSLQDRRDQMLQLGSTLAIGGVVALVVIAFGAWVVLGAALRPVERMRAQAAAISALEPAQRLAVPPGGDELTALATTLNEMLRRLEGAVGRERRFVDDAGHELRTPVAVLRARLDLALSAERSRDELREIVRRSLGDAEHLSRLADDLLVLTQSRDGGLPIHREDVDVERMVNAAVADHRAPAEAADVSIEADIAAGSARVDPIRMRQVLDNLLDNAVRHAGPGGRVVVDASASEGVLRISVEDDGVGFADDVLGRAFEPFARGTTGNGGTGAGLGLSIVDAIARAHAGSAVAENLTTGGARVVVTLGPGGA
jgi:two-component system, OmpR family, sensor kinase